MSLKNLFNFEFRDYFLLNIYIFLLRQLNPIWEGRQKQFSISLPITDSFFLNKAKNKIRNHNSVSFSFVSSVAFAVSVF